MVNNNIYGNPVSYGMLLSANNGITAANITLDCTSAVVQQQFIADAKLICDNADFCNNFISRYESDLYYAEHFGNAKTGIPLYKLSGAAHQTALDACMGGGNMFNGRNYQNEYNYSQWYIQCFQDFSTWLMNAVSSGAINFNYNYGFPQTARPYLSQLTWQ